MCLLTIVLIRKADEVCDANPSQSVIRLSITPPRPSEIREKNWSTKGKPFFDNPFTIRSDAESMK